MRRIRVPAGAVLATLLALLGAFPLGAQDSVATIRPGMTEAEVRARWGTPLTRRSHGAMSYLYYQCGGARRPATFDVVFLERGQVIDAIVRDRRRAYDGISSSPPDRAPAPTPGDTP